MLEIAQTINNLHNDVKQLTNRLGLLDEGVTKETVYQLLNSIN